MARCAYWKGVRLWEHFQDWDPWAQRTADAEHDGVLQPWVKIVPDSPNFRRTVAVPTVVGPRTAGHGGLEVETTIAAELLRVEAYLMARLDSRLQAWLGFGGPFLQAFSALVRYSYPAIEFEADGRVDSATGIMVCNISEVAGPSRMAPAGHFDDGRLELLVFRGRTRAAVAGFSADLFRGAHARRRDVHDEGERARSALGGACCKRKAEVE